jgi:hypothetical protein
MHAASRVKIDWLFPVIESQRPSRVRVQAFRDVS